MTLFSFLSDTILTHGNDNVNMNVLKYSEKRWLSTLFRSRGSRRKSQGQNGAHKRTAARMMSCRLTLFRMALFSFPYVTCSVGPVAPVGPVGPVTPVGPVAPVAPVGPVGPVGPVAPVGQRQSEPPLTPIAVSRQISTLVHMHGQHPHTLHRLYIVIILPPNGAERAFCGQCTHCPYFIIS